MRVRVDDSKSQQPSQSTRISSNDSSLSRTKSPERVVDAQGDSSKHMPGIDQTSSQASVTNSSSHKTAPSRGIPAPRASENIRDLSSVRKTPEDEPYNSEDEHEALSRHSGASLSEWDFAEILRKIQLAIVPVQPDGNCLFRALAIHEYGNENTHAFVRKEVLDFIEAEREWFSSFLAEDFERYVRRKRRNGCHGNHLELQAAAELYRRPIFVYAYRAEPVNIIDCVSTSQNSLYADDARCGDELNCRRDRSPMRLSFHRGSHYNCVLTTDQYSRFRQSYDSTRASSRQGRRQRTGQLPCGIQTTNSGSRRHSPRTEGRRTNGSRVNALPRDDARRAQIFESQANSRRVDSDNDNDSDLQELADVLATEEEMERAAMALSLAEARQSVWEVGASASASSSRARPSESGLIGVQALVDMGFPLDISLEAYQNTGQGSPREMISYISNQLSETKRMRAAQKERFSPSPSRATHEQLASETSSVYPARSLLEGNQVSSALCSDFPHVEPDEKSNGVTTTPSSTTRESSEFTVSEELATPDYGSPSKDGQEGDVTSSICLSQQQDRDMSSSE